MDNTQRFRSVLRRTLVALAVGAGLVVICYFFVDRPVAHQVHDRDYARHPVVKWLTLPPPVVQTWTPLVLAVLVVRRAWGPFRPWERAALAASVAILVADQCRESLAGVFGRYWPDTWIDDNPSLIRNDAYGFHWFHAGSAYGSFPSGHMARSAAVAAVVWIAFPRWAGWTAVAACAAVAAGLIGMNYHFVGDVVAGSFVGGLVGAYAACCCGVGRPEDRVAN